MFANVSQPSLPAICPELRHTLLLWAVALLLPVALLTNLGLLAFQGDESIRALVALEMGIRNDLITPTMFGEPYYNKPPLYNWLLLAVFRLTGRSDELVARLPTVVFLLTYAALIFHFTKKHLSQQPAANLQLLAPLALVTCGRILFWDSMLALIDTCFSLVTYAMFMHIYAAGERERYGRLFTGAYLLAAVGFMLKGLPAVVFVGLALLAYSGWSKKWRLLLSWAHLGGMACFATVVGSYYAAYAQQNGLGMALSTLFNESAKRTFVEHGLGKTLLHLVTFPFEMWYHFLPWTLLAIHLLRKNALQLLRQNRFVSWNAVVLLVTVLPYWASVEVYPRYLLMHVPLAFTVLLYLHQHNVAVESRTAQWVEGIFQVACWLMVPASFAPLWWDAVQHVPLLLPKVAFLAGATGLLALAYWRWKPERLLTFTAVMLVARLGFDWFVLPTRPSVDCNEQVRQTTLEAVRLAKGRPIFIYEESLGFEPMTGYYVTRETGQLLLRQRADHVDKEARYIYDSYRYQRKFAQVAKLKVLWQCSELGFVKIKD